MRLHLFVSCCVFNLYMERGQDARTTIIILYFPDFIADTRRHNRQLTHINRLTFETQHLSDLNRQHLA